MPCEIAIWPSSTLFRAGEQLAVGISGKYGVRDDLLRGFNRLINKGRHSLHTGGRYASFLLVSVLPPPKSSTTYGGRTVAEE